MLSSAVYNYGRQFSSNERKHGDGIQHKNKKYCHRIVRGKVVHIGQIGRCPEEEKPPHTIRYQFGKEDGPGLGESEEFYKGDIAFLLILYRFYTIFFLIVLMDICKFCLIHILTLLWLLVKK